MMEVIHNKIPYSAWGYINQADDSSGLVISPKMRSVLSSGLGLQYFTVSPNKKHAIKQGFYIPKFNEYLNYNDKVAEAIACNVARKIYQVFGNKEQASLMQEEINTALKAMNV